jgi:trk system potassium uptake protein
MRVIIIGGGNTAYFVSKQFASKGYYVTIIDADREDAQKLSRKLKATVLVGSGCTPGILEEAGARQTEIVIALLDHDQDNLIACQIANRVFGVPRTIALINDPENEVIFKQLGVSVAISAARILAQMIEEEAGFEDIVNLMPLAHGRIVVSEVTLTSHSPAIGQSLIELAMPASSLVAAIIRGEEVIVPRGPSRLALYDRLIVVTQPENHSDVLQMLTGGSRA